MKFSFWQIVIFGITVFWAVPAASQTLNLTWDPSTDQAVAGYQLYYQAEVAQPPFYGTEAIQGDSPIDTGPYTTFDISLPDDGRVYYLAVTAYNDFGEESTFSNVIANFPRPVLLGPGPNSPDTGPDVIFSWFHESTDSNTTYTLVFGPEAEVKSSGFYGPGKGPQALWLAVAACLLAFGLWRRCRSGKQARTKLMVLGVCVAGLLSACGGGGGGSGSTTSADGSGTGVILPGIETEIVSGITQQSYQVEDLLPDETYYWKVVAVDSEGREVESVTSSFNTSADF